MALDPCLQKKPNLHRKCKNQNSKNMRFIQIRPRKNACNVHAKFWIWLKIWFFSHKKSLFSSFKGNDFETLFFLFCAPQRFSNRLFDWNGGRQVWCHLLVPSRPEWRLFNGITWCFWQESAWDAGPIVKVINAELFFFNVRFKDWPTMNVLSTSNGSLGCDSKTNLIETTKGLDAVGVFRQGLGSFVTRFSDFSLSFFRLTVWKWHHIRFYR